MPGAARMNQLRLPTDSPIKPEDIPSDIHINVKKFQFLMSAKPEDGLRLSISATVRSVRMDEDGEHFLTADLQEVIAQPKEEKPPEETNGIIPK